MTIDEFMGYVVTVGVSGTMFCMGLSLTTSDFIKVVRKPTALITGLIGQMAVLPLVAISLAVLFSYPTAVAVGLILLAVCPGGVSSNSFSYIAKADIALSVTLTVIASFVSFITIPAIMSIGFGIIGGEATSIELPFWDTSLRIFKTIAVPIFAGLLIRFIWPSFAISVVTPLFWVSFGSIWVSSIYGAWNVSSIFGHRFGIWVIAGASLNIVMLAIGFLMAKLARLSPKHVITITLEIGMQSVGVALVIAIHILKDISYLLPSISYVTCSLITASIIAKYGSRWIEAEEVVTPQR